MGRDANEEASGRRDPEVAHQMRLAWLADYAIDKGFRERDMRGMVIARINIKGPSETGGDYFATIKAYDDNNRPFVAFRSAVTPLELRLKIARDIENGSLKYKEETPYENRKGAS